jgi:hypothetical protein
MGADSLLDEILALVEELLGRFGTVYGIEPQQKHRTEAVMIAFGRLAPATSPRPQPSDLGDDEVVKALARTAASIRPENLYVLAAEDASPEKQLLHDVANITLEALADCGKRLEG